MRVPKLRVPGDGGEKATVDEPRRTIFMSDPGRRNGVGRGDVYGRHLFRWGKGRKIRQNNWLVTGTMGFRDFWGLFSWLILANNGELFS